MTNLVACDMVIGKHNGAAFAPTEVQALLEEFLAWIDEHDLQAVGTWGLVECDHSGHDDPNAPNAPGFN